MEKLHYFTRSNYGNISYYLVEEDLRYLVRNLLDKRSDALTQHELLKLAELVNYPSMADLVRQADPAETISA